MNREPLLFYRLNEERTLHGKQENEYQQTISSLQKKIADMIKQHTKAMDEIKRDLHQERLTAQKRVSTRPCVPVYVQVFDLRKSDKAFLLKFIFF